MKLKPIKAEKLIKLMYSLGYEIKRKRGSHVILENTNENKINVVPVHAGKDVGVGLVLKILKEIGLSKEEFLALLEKK